ncbi:MAG: tetratricopeptide repeat protein, partial [bacterium]
QILLVSCVFFSLFCWILSSLLEEKITIKTSVAGFLLIAFIIVVGLATLFSSYRYASFWGWPLGVFSSFLSSISFVVLYFLITHLFSRKELSNLPLLFVCSGLLVVVVGIFQIFGKFVFPFNFSQTLSFNTVGTINGLAVFLASLLPLSFGLFSYPQKAVKALAGLFALCVIFYLFATSFWVAWVSLLLASFFGLVIGITRGKIKISFLLLPAAFLVISLFALGLRSTIFPINNLPIEVFPALRTTFNVATDTIINSRPPVSFFLGSGPSTFVFDYSLYKPQSINQTIFWETRFVSGNSEILEQLATTGILGLLTFLAIIFYGLFCGIKNLISQSAEEKETEWMLSLTVFSGFVAITTTLFFYSANISLLLVFWVLLAMVLRGSGKAKEFAVRSFSPIPSGEKPVVPWQRMAIAFVFIALLIGWLGIAFTQGQRFFAERNYFSALEAAKKGDYSFAVDRINRAIVLTGSKQDNYWQDLAYIWIAWANKELQEDLSSEKALEIINSYGQQAISSAERAIAIAPMNVSNWIAEGSVYVNLNGFFSGATEKAIIAYEKAAELDPTNPLIFTELGKIYLKKADAIMNEETANPKKQAYQRLARENFIKASSLKGDYMPVYFNMALLDISEGKIDDAIIKLEALRDVAPSDSALAFQLGMAYREKKEIEKAKEELERAVSLNANYSNARYFLGLIYDAEGNKKEALAQFEKVLELNPGNKEIEKIVANLKAGKPALEEISN